MKKMLLLIGALLVALPVQAQTAAQDDAALAALRASMSAHVHASLTSAVRDARQRGLPTQPLITKAQEGVAKKIPGERIVAAVRTTIGHLGRAHVLLRGSTPPRASDVSDVADALQRGVPEDAIARLASDERGRSSIALSSHALADLIGHGVPLAVGVEVMNAWRAQGSDAARLKEIPAAVERLVRQGVVPAHAGAAVAAGIKQGRSPASITPVEIPRMIGRGRGGES
jgi:hypothetical protein